MFEILCKFRGGDAHARLLRHYFPASESMDLPKFYLSEVLFWRIPPLFREGFFSAEGRIFFGTQNALKRSKMSSKR